ncbi:MAG: glycosyltransferase family 2 protein [Acidobacteria bacterium]|nr:glycosyltransferase family 2 protein [Acidobacteriota bacterium]
MIQGHKISVVIPCYNEDEGIRRVLESLPGSVDERIVVDNNSTNGAGEVALSLGARVLFEGRQGYGHAYRAGLPEATGDIIATLDGDGSYPAERIPALVEMLLAENLDFISGCRFPLENPAAMPWSNRIGNFLLTLAMVLLYGRRIRDSQSGMWIFRRSLLSALVLSSGGMPLSEEIKLETIQKGFRFREVHIPYRDRIGEAKLRKWKDGWENLVFLVKKRWRR